MTDANVVITLLRKWSCVFESRLKPEKVFQVFFQCCFDCVCIWICHHVIILLLLLDIYYRLTNCPGKLGILLHITWKPLVGKYIVEICCSCPVRYALTCHCIRDWKWRQFANCSKLYVKAVFHMLNIAKFCSHYLYSVVLNSLRQIGTIFLFKPSLPSSKFVSSFLKYIYLWLISDGFLGELAAHWR